ncbi:hypothetical protein PAHAL_9G225600 [Panicum hallii]|uniref:Uncharacterized protein n=1 Tax=Panicum hallii TaxID=206008 RepID=A0A2T8I285_9POAL|nr:hypothetical protein PAHAL_9G225600 [Panicum hallii]
MICSSVMLPISGGMLPVSLLPPRYSDLTFSSLPISGGIEPVRLLPSSLRSSNLVRLAISTGIAPTSPKDPKSSAASCLSFPMLRGIDPVRCLLLVILNKAKLVELPIPSGMVPCK